MYKIYLNNGCLEIISRQKSLFELSSQSAKEGEENSESPLFDYKHHSRPFIVEVEEISQFENDYLLLKLTDGTGDCMVLMDLNSSNLKHFELKIGTVLIIEVTSLVFFKNSKFDSRIPILQEFQIIGVKESNSIFRQNLSLDIDTPNAKRPRTSIDLDEKVSLDDAINILEEDDSLTYKSVTLLTPSDSGKIMKLYMSNKSTIDEFTNRNGKAFKMRIQFQDKSGYIEAVQFGLEKCKVLNELLLNKWYLISGADIKEPSSKQYKLWRNVSPNSQFDLIFKETTKIEMIHINDPNPRDSSTKSINDQTKTVIPVTIKEILSEKNEFITSLDKISMKKVGSMINILAVITSINKLSTWTRTGKNPTSLPLLHFFVSDLSLKKHDSVRVALWGDQAVKFYCDIGSIVFIERCEVKTYQGLTLQVLYSTKITLNPKGLPSVSDLKERWKREIKPYLKSLLIGAETIKMLN